MSLRHLFFFLLFLSLKTSAQIGAEAQGGLLTVWAAIGLDQKISKRWTSMTDLGFGRHGGEKDLALVKYQGLKVITQDFIYQLNSHWRITFSGGYWNRNYYSDQLPANRVELRPFSRVYYLHHLGSSEMSHQFRQDFRWFFQPNFQKWEPSFEYRIRYMVQEKIPLGRADNFLIFNDEILAISDKKNGGSESTMSSLQLSENRLSGYFRHHFQAYRVDLDLGLMHQYWRKESTGLFTISYNVMADLIIRDPFGGK